MGESAGEKLGNTIGLTFSWLYTPFHSNTEDPGIGNQIPRLHMNAVLLTNPYTANLLLLARAEMKSGNMLLAFSLDSQACIKIYSQCLQNPIKQSQGSRLIRKGATALSCIPAFWHLPCQAVQGKRIPSNLQNQRTGTAVQIH